MEVDGVKPYVDKDDDVSPNVAPKGDKFVFENLQNANTDPLYSPWMIIRKRIPSKNLGSKKNKGQCRVCMMRQVEGSCSWHSNTLGATTKMWSLCQTKKQRKMALDLKEHFGRQINPNAEDIEISRSNPTFCKASGIWVVWDSSKQTLEVIDQLQINLWRDLMRIVSTMNNLWSDVGDFNVVLRDSKRSKSASSSINHIDASFQQAKVFHLPYFGLGHDLILMSFQPLSKPNARRRPFRFEGVWLTYTKLNEVVRRNWGLFKVGEPSWIIFSKL
ncbi:hypothetical protein Fmac_009058 [Flemingia macrophylla]|uniref:Uncharacterized protein n=1 Tax=Flemingia macrophylla TaxID=520843 RepID=A0ABD1N0C6_9FABA